MANFSEALAIGKSGETQIANWLKNRGSNVLPIYEIAENQFKGPALYCHNNETIIAPDMMVFNKKGEAIFVEAKHKYAFSWHRKTERFVTGIDLHHYQQYLKIQETLKHPVWLFFLHRGGIAKDSPPSPSGLYARSLEFLSIHENHRSDLYGKNGMVYWNIDDLIKLDNYPFLEIINDE